jgi:hypothetical protein
VSEDVRVVCKLPHDDLPVVTRMFLRILDPQVYQGTLAFGDQFGSNPKKELRNANTSRRVLHLLQNEKLFLPKGTGIERVSLSNLTIYVVPMILVPRSAGGNGMPLLLSRSRKNARLPGAGQSRHRPHCAHGPNRVPL